MEPGELLRGGTVAAPGAYIVIPFAQRCAFTTLVYGTRLTKGNGVV